MAKDIHVEPFDEGTRAKLNIFEDYIKEWIPVFLPKANVKWQNVNIIDFFAGPGMDLNGIPGTPLIILNSIKPYFPNIINNGIKLNLYFNEYKKEKYDKLGIILNGSYKKPGLYSIEILNLEFNEVFPKWYSLIDKQGTANLLLLDQNGVKQIRPEIFEKIISLKTTDFIFFISSSTIKRFCEHPSISNYLKISKEELEKIPFYDIHRKVVSFYKSLIPQGKKYHIGSFSLKKGSNIYGLIFGSGHYLGLEKFLKVCWREDPERGEANFDIDKDRINLKAPSLFMEYNIPKKIQLFEKELVQLILKGTISNNHELFLFAIERGHLAIHVRLILSKMFAANKLDKQIIPVSAGAMKKAPVSIKLKYGRK